MRILLVAFAIVLTFSQQSIAEAQIAPADVPANSSGSHGASVDQIPKGLWTAYLTTIAATAIPIAIGSIGVASFEERGVGANAMGILGLAGMVFGPSAGHWYADEIVTTGLVLRGVSATTALGLAIIDPRLDHPETVVGLLGAALLWETGVVWDLVTLPGAVRRYNRETRWRIAPMITEAGPVAGLAIGSTY